MCACPRLKRCFPPSGLGRLAAGAMAAAGGGFRSHRPIGGVRRDWGEGSPPAIAALRRPRAGGGNLAAGGSPSPRPGRHKAFEADLGAGGAATRAGPLSVSPRPARGRKRRVVAGLGCRRGGGRWLGSIGKWRWACNRGKPRTPRLSLRPSSTHTRFFARREPSAQRAAAGVARQTCRRGIASARRGAPIDGKVEWT